MAFKIKNTLETTIYKKFSENSHYIFPALSSDSVVSLLLSPFTLLSSGSIFFRRALTLFHTTLSPVLLACLFHSTWLVLDWSPLNWASLPASCKWYKSGLRNVLTSFQFLPSSCLTSIFTTLKSNSELFSSLKLSFIVSSFSSALPCHPILLYPPQEDFVTYAGQSNHQIQSQFLQPH